MNLYAIRFIQWLHLVCVMLIVFGWIFPARYLWIHLLAIPLVILHWWKNNGECFLTQMEHRLRGEKPADEVQGQFVTGLMQKALGMTPTKMQLLLTIYGVLFASWLISLMRFSNTIRHLYSNTPQ